MKDSKNNEQKVKQLMNNIDKQERYESIKKTPVNIYNYLCKLFRKQ